jgi:hypothetical protein
LIRDTDYTNFVQFRTPEQALNAIQFVDQLDNGAPAALVPVSNDANQHSLDIYIYGCSMQQHSPQLHLLFKQQDLLEGSVQISKTKTLLIGSLDSTLSNSARMQIEPWQQYIYHEYGWQQGRFVPLVFPGFYPVLTRSEAEILQDQFNSGQELPWNDPLTTARQLALDLLHWPAHELYSHLQATNATTTRVLVWRKHPYEQIEVTLSRLIQAGKNGLWFVTGAQSPGLTLDTHELHAPLNSPLFLNGTLLQRVGIVRAELFNHLLTPLPLLNKPILHMLPGRTFSTTLFYTNNAPNQPGILLLENRLSEKSKSQIILMGVLLA